MECELVLYSRRGSSFSAAPLHWHRSVPCEDACRYRVNAASSPTLQVTLDFKLALPQVAVVGSQSSGKSSVLEALVRHRTPRFNAAAACGSCTAMHTGHACMWE